MHSGSPGHTGHGHSQRQAADLEEVQSARLLVNNLLKESLSDLLGEDQCSEMSVRWELGACWVQHLQTQAAAEKADDKSADGVKGNTNEGGVPNAGSTRNGKHSKQNSVKESQETSVESVETEDKPQTNATEPDDCELRSLLSEAAFNRLKETETGLHNMVSGYFFSPSALNSVPFLD